LLEEAHDYDYESLSLLFSRPESESLSWSFQLLAAHFKYGNSVVLIVAAAAVVVAAAAAGDGGANGGAGSGGCGSAGALTVACFPSHPLPLA